MRINSLLKPKHMVWASGAVLAVILLIVLTRSGTKASVQSPPPPIVEVAPVEQRDVPVYGEWIGTLTGQVNADVKAQVTGYLLTRKYKEGSYVRKGELLFEIDPRPFQAALDQAKAQLAQAKAQLIQDQAQRATAQANQQMSQLNVDKDAPLAQVDAVSKQDFDNADQTNLANTHQVLAAEASLASSEAQIQVSEDGVETAGINLGFTRIVSPIDGIAGIAQAQVGDLVNTSSGVLTTVSTVDPIRDYFAVSEQEYLALQKHISNPTKNPCKFQLLRPGQYGKVRAMIREQQNAMLIPQAAVNQEQGSYSVAVVDRDNHVSMRAVQVGQRTDSMWVIQSGLNPGERVAVEGQQNLRRGMPEKTNPTK